MDFFILNKKGEMKMVSDLLLKTLVFEGAGCLGTGTQEVPNCRIRTRIKNNEGRLIYLELGGVKFEGKKAPQSEKGFNISGRIDHVFYCDSYWDDKRNHSAGLDTAALKKPFEYDKKTILKLVNENLNCSFEDLAVINDGIRVHDTEEPLCDCSTPGYIPYKEKEFNINLLKDIKTIRESINSQFAQYKLSYEFIQKLPAIKNYIATREGRELKLLPKYTYYASLRWDNLGIIRNLEISARENFVCMSMGIDTLEKVINELTKQKNEKRRE